MAQPSPLPAPTPLAAISGAQPLETIKRKYVNGNTDRSAEMPSEHNEAPSMLSNGTATAPTSTSKSALKYHHVVAVHDQVRSSCLSHDSAASPSFLGFRNLMVIVLSKCLFRIGVRYPTSSSIHDLRMR